MEPSDKQRKAWAKAGWAMPDGSYYIRPGNKQDLQDAIDAVGRGSGGDAGHNAIRRHIMDRASAPDMKCGYMIPKNWNSDGSLKHGAGGEILGIFGIEFQPSEDVLAHFGVLGMKWGHRKTTSINSTADRTGKGNIRAKVPVSSSTEHQHAALLRAKVKYHGGVHALSNAELEALTRRMNLERQYSTLATTGKSDVDRGRAFVKSGVADVKMTLDAINTGRRLYNEVNNINNAYQGNRQRGHNSGNVRIVPGYVTS